jgi:hypothetical protein
MRKPAIVAAVAESCRNHRRDETTAVEAIENLRQKESRLREQRNPDARILDRQNG